MSRVYKTKDGGHDFYSGVTKVASIKADGSFQDINGITLANDQDIQNAAADKASYYFADTNYLVTGSSPVLTLGLAFSTCVSFKQKQLSSTYSHLCVLHGTGTDLIILRLTATGLIEAYFRNSAGSFDVLTTTTYVTDFLAHTIALTRDNSGNVKFYLDGNVVSGTYSSTKVLSSDTYAQVGEPTAGYSLIGHISRALVFNYELTQGQIIRISDGAKLDYEDVGGSVINSAINGGAAGQTDWANPTSGLAQYWQGASSLGKSIVTGNGFTGNAQRAAYSTTSADTTLRSNGSSINGKRYSVSLKYRASKAVTIFMLTGNSPLGTLALNTGNAVSASIVITADCTNPSYCVGFTVIGAIAGDYLEIDEVVIYQLGAALLFEPENITTQAWIDASGNGLNAIVSGALANRITPIGSSKNYIINGAFDFWQRGGASPVNTVAGTYNAADRWKGLNNVTSQNRQTSGTLPQFNYICRWAYTSTSSADYIDFSQVIETLNVRELQGKWCTLSFYARKSADLADINFYAEVRKSASVDAMTSPSTIARSPNLINSLPPASGSTWLYYSLPFFVPNDATANTIDVHFASLVPGTTHVIGSFIDIAGVMLNQGPVAAPFERAGGSIGGELALCQRYYVQLSGYVFNLRAQTLATDTNVRVCYDAAVPMRIAPAFSYTPNGGGSFLGSITVSAITSPTTGTATVSTTGTGNSISMAIPVGTGLGSWKPVISEAAALTLSAEL